MVVRLIGALHGTGALIDAVVVVMVLSIFIIEQIESVAVRFEDDFDASSVVKGSIVLRVQKEVR